MKRTVLLLLAFVAVAALAAGCEKFTKKRFDTMVMKGQSQVEVEKILGPPDAKWTRKWRWVNFDKHFSGTVLFDTNGFVVGKAWSDSERQDIDPETQWRKGDWPTDGQGQCPQPVAPGNSSTTTTEIVVP
jgi:hypothetical protein